MPEQAIEAAIERATTFLLDARDPRGWWRDFHLSPGVSDEWVTGYVGTTLSRVPDPRAAEAVQSAWQVLATRRKALGRWGYNIFTPGDGDSTGWGVQFAYAVGAHASDRALEARAALATHLTADGGFSTYADEPAIRKFIGETDTGLSFRGWCGTQVCVTAALSAIPDTAESACAFLRQSQQPDGSWQSYWWSDHTYATTLATEALARGSGADHARVQHAVAWSRGLLTPAGCVVTPDHPGGSPFSTALCLRTLLTDETDASMAPIRAVSAWLQATQRADGSWSASAMLRVPSPDDVAPDDFAGWVRGGAVQGSIVADHARLFTTATVLWALLETRHWLRRTDPRRIAPHRSLLALVSAYQARGPVFAVGNDGQRGLVLAGPAANRLLERSGDRYFSNRPFYSRFACELGSERFIVALDGEPHRAMRRLMKPAFDWSAVARYLPTIEAATRQTVQGWSPGERVDVPALFRRLITEQTSVMMTGRGPGENFEAFSHFFKGAVAATLGQEVEPTGLESDPGYQQARASVHATIREVLAEHRAQPATERPDFVDLLLANTAGGQAPLTDDDLVAACLVPFFAGIETVAYTCGFALYHVLKDPDLCARVLPEVAYPGAPTLDTIRAMVRLRNVVLETLRAYPVAPAAVRRVIETFDLEGTVVEAGQTVVLATPVTHFLPELFPEPLRFDPDRFAEHRAEHRNPGAFVPFFKGPHTCLGAGLGEVQVMLTLATLLRHARLELDPPEFELEVVADPILRPANAYTMFVVGPRA